MAQVSVIVPNYNHARFLERRLSSILNQSRQDFEIIFLDDASTDDSKQVFAQFAHDSRIRTAWNKTNSGSPFVQWNKGVREARGQYIWIAESDDYADTEFLATLLAPLEQNPKIGIAFCDSWVVDQSERPLRRISEWLNELQAARWHRDFTGTGHSECRNYMALRNVIPNASAVVFRKDIYLQTGGADPAMKLAGDWLLWIKMLQLCDLAYTARPLNYFRTHSQSSRDRAIYSGKRTQENYSVTRYIFENFELPLQQREKACQALAADWLNVLLALKGTDARKQTKSIYEVARHVDPRLRSRLMKTAPRIFTGKIKEQYRQLAQRNKNGNHKGGAT